MGIILRGLGDAQKKIQLSFVSHSPTKALRRFSREEDCIGRSVPYAARFSAMPQTHEIFARMPPEVAAQLFTHLHDKEKALYKATIETLAKQRKLRPVFVERKPRDERFAWLREAIARKQNESVGAHLLQIWFVGAQSKFLCDFLH